MPNLPPELPDPRLPDDLRATIGEVTTEWALLELYVDFLVWQLADVSREVGACITAQFPNISRRLDALTALAELRSVPADIIKDINRFHEETHSIARKRNRVVHDTWSVGVKTKKPYRLEISASKKLVYEYKEIPTARVHEVAMEIRKHRFRFNALADRIEVILSSLLAKQP